MKALHRNLAWAGGTLALAFLLFAPERALAAAPLLLLLLCPILMVFMMRGMHHHGPGPSERAVESAPTPRDEGEADRLRPPR